MPKLQPKIRNADSRLHSIQQENWKITNYTNVKISEMLQPLNYAFIVHNRNANIFAIHTILLIYENLHIIHDSIGLKRLLN